MIRQGGKGCRRVDHTGRAGRFGENSASERRERAAKPQLVRGIDRAGADCRAERKCIESAAEARLELVVERKGGVELVADQRKRVPIEESYACLSREFGGELFAPRTFLCRDRPDAIAG